jgi:hypothetical protein
MPGTVIQVPLMPALQGSIEAPSHYVSMKCLQCSRNAFIRELFYVTVSRPKTGNAHVNIRLCFLFTILLLATHSVVFEPRRTNGSFNFQTCYFFDQIIVNQCCVSHERFQWPKLFRVIPDGSKRIHVPVKVWAGRCKASYH